MQSAHRYGGRRLGGGRVRRAWRASKAVATLLVCVAPATASATEFPVPGGLEPAVRFWIDVFTRHSTADAVLHDRVDLGRVYEVVHGDAARDETLLEPHVRRIADGPAVPRLWEPLAIGRILRPDHCLDPLASARERVRVQRGMREAFADGLRAARRYRRVVERVLARERLPLELAALPLVESSYDPDATSSAGAVGLWQLTPDAVDGVLRVSGRVDERRDPVRATVAAARLLGRLRAALPSWPLAITAYNHGLVGVQRGRRAVGSDDLGVLVRYYRGPGFGFASRNFYAEFLAALHVQRHVGQYFPDLAAERTIEYQVKRGDSLFAVARRHGVTVPRLRATNGLKSERLRPGQVLLIRS